MKKTNFPIKSLILASLLIFCMGLNAYSKEVISAQEIVKAILAEDSSGKELVWDGKTIRGKFDLKHRVIPVAISITNCTFEDEVDLSYAEFRQCVNFYRSTFNKGFDSHSAIYQKHIACNGITFEDEANFNGIQCEGGFFRNAHFYNAEKEINFARARFGVDLDCTGAEFKGGAIFDGIQCEDSGFFQNAHFYNAEKEINFVRARFGVDLDCTGAEFKGGATFDTIQCGYAGFFTGTKFDSAEKDIDFRSARFGIGLNCTGAEFKGGAIFNSIQCEGCGFFSNAHFLNAEKYIDFSYAKFGINLELSDAFFAGRAFFFHTQVTGSLVLTNTIFQKYVSFECAKFYTFRLEDSREEKDSGIFKGYVNLQRLIFSIFQGNDRQQKHVLGSQAPDKFSIDPYLQFEKYYNSIGDDSNAKDVYYEGRKKLRENARHKANPDINWSKGKLILDYLNCWLVGYGVRMGRTFIYLGLLLLAGILIFWSDDAMIPKSINAKTSGFMMAVESSFQEDLDAKTLSDGLRQRFKDKSLTLSQDATIEIDKNGKEWNIADPPNNVIYRAKPKGNGIRIYNSTPFAEHLLHRFGYSLHMLLPIVNLRIADDYKFPSDWDNIWSILRGFYTIFHIIAGWVLIPLLISALAGVLRKM